MEAVIAARSSALIGPSAAGSQGDVCVAADMTAVLVVKMATGGEEWGVLA